MLVRRPVQAISCLVRGFSNIAIRESTKVFSAVPPRNLARETKADTPLRITFLPREISLDIGHSRNINPLIPRKEIIDIPLISRIIENPNQSRISEIGDRLPAVAPVVDLPTSSGKVDDNGIQAARLIVIRRRKMRKHKLKKLRKKMKYEWAKVRQRRELRKEKAFQAGLINQIKEAERFSAEMYVAEKLRQANDTPIPRFWKGKRLPQFIIKQKLGIE
uniref:Ribosomal protein mS38 C-terminal domain-containing protein n=1 Tax=Aedes aegypti TaxID=7159 RepID=Q1HRL4_AEDAE|nr:unknown [Aedes aegypti]